MRLKKIQLERLKETVSYIYERVEPYRRKMDEANVKPDDIQSLDDLKKMPFTYKADFRENYPTGLFAVEKRICSFSCKFRNNRKADGCRIYEEGP